MKGILLTILLFITQFSLAQPSSTTTASVSDTKAPNDYVLNGRMGLQKNLHKLITPAVYDTLYQLNPSRYVGKRFNTTKQQSYWGIIDAGGNLVVPFKYRVLKVTQAVVIVGMAEKNILKYGAFSLAGTELITPKYESVKVLSKDLIIAKKRGSTLVFNRAGVKVFQIEADSISWLKQDLLRIIVNGKAGITKLNNRVMVSNNYRDVQIVDDDILVKRFPHWQIVKGYDTLNLYYDNVIDWGSNFIVTSGNKSLLINQNDQVISKSYDNITKVNNKIALISDNNRLGVINTSGAEIIPIGYSQIINDKEVIYARLPGKHAKWLLFDYYGFAKTTLKYDSVSLISEGRIAFKRNGKWGYLDRYGVEVITPIFDKASQFKQGEAVVTFFGEDGIINRMGKWVALPTTINIIAYNNNTLLGKINAQYQIKRYNGELIYFTGNRLEMTNAGFSERDSSDVLIRKISWTGTFEYYNTETEITMAGGSGLLVFKKNGKYGFKDQRHRIVIANRYEAVKPFHQRLAAIKINNKWGFINLDEHIVIQPRYDSVGHFNSQNCLTRKNSLYGVINLVGDEIVPNQYEQIKPLGSGQFRVQKNGKWGVLNEQGALVIYPKYSSLYPVNQSFYIIERNGKYGTINNLGVNKIPMLYDFIGYNNESKTLITKMAYKDEWVFLMKTHSSNN